MSPLGYLKLGAALVVLAGAVFVSWDYRGRIAEEEKAHAVAAAVQQAEKDLKDERALRLSYQALADTKLEALLKSISNLKIEHKTVTNNITREREIHKEFYAQPLPESGYEQWKRSRAMAVAPAASSPP